MARIGKQDSFHFLFAMLYNNCVPRQPSNVCGIGKTVEIDEFGHVGLVEDVVDKVGADEVCAIGEWEGSLFKPQRLHRTAAIYLSDRECPVSRSGKTMFAPPTRTGSTISWKRCCAPFVSIRSPRPRKQPPVRVAYRYLSERADHLDYKAAR